MKHLAYEYARRGACLVLAARRVNSLREVAEIASILGSPSAIHVGTDVSEVEDCKRLIETTIEHFGQCEFIIFAKPKAFYIGRPMHNTLVLFKFMILLFNPIVKNIFYAA